MGARAAAAGAGAVLAQEPSGPDVFVAGHRAAGPRVRHRQFRRQARHRAATGQHCHRHRRIKRLRHKPAQQKQALFHLHQAFNQTFGASVFAADIEHFIERHPRFVGLRTQITAFFERSNRALFAGDEQGMSAAELLALSRSLRDSERRV